MVIPLAFGWRHLLFANWPVDSDLLATSLPAALSIDEHDNTGWLSIIPFINVHTRPRGLPEWVGISLPELNLRTYVTCDGEPGIYFFSLDAHGLLSVFGARLFHHLAYYYARIQFQRKDGCMEFTSRRFHPGDRPAHYSASYWPTGNSFMAGPGSRAEFLTERRRLYTQAPDRTIRYTDVEHDRWTLYPATVSVEENTLFQANGFDHPNTEAELYYSPGVDVVTTRNKPWD